MNAEQKKNSLNFAASKSRFQQKPEVAGRHSARVMPAPQSTGRRMQKQISCRKANSWQSGKVLLLAKNDSWCNHAVTLSRIAFGDRLIVHQGTINDPFPEIQPNRWYALLSYRSPWVIPADLLSRSEVAINFHPGSRDYPGYGCYSFAIYERAAEYGCVCHHMARIVDTGPLIEERR